MPDPTLTEAHIDALMDIAGWEHEDALIPVVEQIVAECLDAALAPVRRYVEHDLHHQTAGRVYEDLTAILGETPLSGDRSYGRPEGRRNPESPGDGDSEPLAAHSGATDATGVDRGRWGDAMSHYETGAQRTNTAPADSGAIGQLNERQTVDALLACLPMHEDGTGHIADCGYDEDATPTCGCYSLPGRLTAIVREHTDRALDEITRLRAALDEARAEVERLRRGGEELGKSLVFWLDLAVKVTGSEDCIDDDGDGDYGAVAERLAEMPARAAALKAKLAEVQRTSRVLPCDGLCQEYPKEDCSLHGREPAELWEAIAEKNKQATAAEAALVAERAKSARFAQRIANIATEQDDARLAVARVRAVCDKPDDVQWWPVQPYMDPPDDDEVTEVRVLSVDRVLAALDGADAGGEQ